MCVSSQSHLDSVSGSHGHPRHPPGQREAWGEGDCQRPGQPRGPGCVEGALSHSTGAEAEPCSNRQQPSREHRFLRLAASAAVRFQKRESWALQRTATGCKGRVLWPGPSRMTPSSTCTPRELMKSAGLQARPTLWESAC